MIMAEKRAARIAAKKAKIEAKAEAKAIKAKEKEIRNYNKLVKKGKAEAKKPTVELF